MGVVLITGATSSIGRSIALEFAKKKYDIIIHYNKNYNEAEEIKNEIEKIGVNAFIYKADISNETEVNNMFAFISSKYLKIDILINNAALSIDDNIISISKNDFMKVLEVNIFGTFLVTRCALNYMNNGIIVNISSTDSIDTYNEYNVNYSVSKASINLLTKIFASFYPNIKVLGLMPLWVNTKSVREMNPEFLEKELLRTGQTRLLEPIEVASKVIDLVESNTLSGSIIRMEE